MTRMRITTGAASRPHAARRRHDARALGALVLPDPVLTASGLRRGRARARPVRRPHRHRRGRHEVDHARAAVGPRRPRGWPRRRAGCSTRSACRARASTPSSSKDLAWLRRRGARAVVSIAGSSVDEYGRARARGCAPSTASRPSRSTSPARTSRTAARSSPATRLAAAAVVARGPAGDRTPASRSSPSSRPTSPTSSRSRRRCVDAGADGAVADQHPARHGHRHRHDAAGARPASPAGCPARRSGRSPCAASGRCTRRCRTCRSSAWAASAPASTRSSSSWPVRRRCRSAPWSSTTRPRPSGSLRELARRRSPSAGSPGSPTRSATRTARRTPYPAPPAAGDAPGAERRRVDVGRRPGRAVSVVAPAPVAVALDAPDLATALGWAGAAGPSRLAPCKVGLELFLRDGGDGGRRASRDARRTARRLPRPQAARHPEHRGRCGPVGRRRCEPDLPDRARVRGRGHGPRRRRGAARHPGRRRHRPDLAVRRRPRRGRPARPGARRRPPAGRRSPSAPARGRSSARRRRSPRSAPRSGRTSR